MRLGKAAMEALQAEITGRLFPGDEIVAVGPAGLKGTSVIAKEKEVELAKYFSKGFLKDSQNLYETYRADTEKEGLSPWDLGVELGAHSLYEIGEGGFLAALWKMTEASEVGLSVDLRKIPIRQETIEISEIFSVNPYRLYGKGSILIGTPSGEELVFKLEKLGFMAAVIGQTEKGIARKLYSGENFRYLERPSKDELKGVVTTWQD